MKRREWGTLCLTLPGRILLLLTDGQPWEPAQISEAIGSPAGNVGYPSAWAVRRALTRLRAAGAVEYSRTGNRFYWTITLGAGKLDRSHVLLDRLRAEAVNVKEAVNVNR